MATHSSAFAWRIPWMGEPGGLTMSSQDISYCGDTPIIVCCPLNKSFLSTYLRSPRETKPDRFCCPLSSHPGEELVYR